MTRDEVIARVRAMPGCSDIFDEHAAGEMFDVMRAAAFSDVCTRTPPLVRAPENGTADVSTVEVGTTASPTRNRTCPQGASGTEAVPSEGRWATWNERGGR